MYYLGNNTKGSTSPADAAKNLIPASDRSQHPLQPTKVSAFDFMLYTTTNGHSEQSRNATLNIGKL